MPRIYLSAGEASGDVHAAALARELRVRDGSVELLGMGGPAMADAGVEIIQHIDRLAVMGFGEVVGRLPYIYGVFRRLRAELAERRCDVAVLVDYPGFHLKFAEALNELEIPVVVYIAPQVWAWKPKRVHRVARVAKKVLVIFDFEVDPLRAAGADVEFVGHPLLDEIDLAASGGKARARLDMATDEPLLAILPGSRKQVVRRMLPLFVAAANEVRGARPDVKVAIGTQGGEPLPHGCDAVGLPPTVDTHDLLRDATAALYASGTVTLEGAVLGCPGIVGYRLNWLSYLIGRSLVKLPHVALPNIVMGREVMREMIQGELRPARAAAELLRFLTDATRRDEAAQAMRGVIHKLGDAGASGRAAEAVLGLL